MININKLKKSFRFTVFFIAIVSAAQAVAVAQVIELNYNFRGGTLGWTADFADYPPHINPPDNSVYELFAGVRFMPRKLTRLPRRGFFFQGHNRSDDLFMFLKRRLTTEDGIVAGQTYRIQFVITLASDAPSGCGGIGGAPGESVFLKVGASPIEPLAVLQSHGHLRMNVDKGNQIQSGPAASLAGNIANGVPCAQALPFFTFALIERAHEHIFNVAASANGELWLLVGTDSGFEGRTRLYYQSIRVKLISVNNFRNKINGKLTNDLVKIK